jgi:hypothetical protein
MAASTVQLKMLPIALKKYFIERMEAENMSVYTDSLECQTYDTICLWTNLNLFFEVIGLTVKKRIACPHFHFKVRLNQMIRKRISNSINQRHYRSSFFQKERIYGKKFARQTNTSC